MSGKPRTWFLVEIEGDDASHAAQRDHVITYCDKRVSFPKGGTARPTCPDCRQMVAALDPQETP
jgi:hypothetical protein